MTLKDTNNDFDSPIVGTAENMNDLREPSLELNRTKFITRNVALLGVLSDLCSSEQIRKIARSLWLSIEEPSYRPPSQVFAVFVGSQPLRSAKITTLFTCSGQQNNRTFENEILNFFTLLFACDIVTFCRPRLCEK